MSLRGPRAARFWGVTAVLAGLSLPFVGKPVHLDDANFLRLAEGARADWWRPHALSINWQGTLEPAFAVLSNPPGIGWWLAPVALASPWVQHLWMMAWLPVAAWGAWALGERFAGRGGAAALLLLSGPLGLLATQSLMPDLPLFACVLAGLGGVVQRGGALTRRWPFALLLGLAACFRYSGVAVLPLVVLYALLQENRRAAVVLGAAAGLPLALLFAHDLHAYGQVHLLAMVGFQGAEGGGARDLARKALASLGYLGAAGALPLLGGWRGRAMGGAIGVGLGLMAAILSAQAGGALGVTLLACGLGGATIGACLDATSLSAESARRDALWLAAWLGLGLLFLLRLRFAAGRYWLPFLAPAVLLPLAHASQRQVLVAGVVTASLGVAVAVSDAELAHAQRDLAAWVLEQAEGETGLIAGHWGFQHHLERAGWAPLEDDSAVPPGGLLARSAVSWPQEAAGCVAPQGSATAAARWPLRIHTVEGGANLHAFVISGAPPVEVYAPWALGGTDPLDTVVLLRGCTP